MTFPITARHWHDLIVTNRCPYCLPCQLLTPKDAGANYQQLTCNHCGFTATAALTQGTESYVVHWRNLRAEVEAL